MIHVPRAAGTSISVQVYGRFIGHFSVQDLDLVAPRDVRSLPRFAVVRNPWDRLVSAWSFARRNPALEANSSDLSQDYEPNVRILNGQRYQIPEFETFERFVNDWLLARDLQRLDGVFRPQACFVRNAKGGLPLDFLGRFENLDLTEAWLADVTGSQIRLPHFNAASSVDYRSCYTPRLKNLVGDLYGDDVAAFGYDF
jgi:hypothetical protein